jgi:hypothetical protein
MRMQWRLSSGGFCRPILSTLGLLVVSALIASGCKPAVTKAPPRPNSIPKDAVWRGGPDGGSWFKCDSAKADSSFYWMSVYFESDGEVWVRGSFSLEGTWILPESLAQRISCYDGTSIFLMDGRWLKPQNVVEPDVNK